MDEWRSAAVERIAALGPGRVLELGVGNGLLLRELAGRSECYWGTDLSAAAVEGLRDAVAGESWADRVELRVGSALETESLPEGYFDTVVLNSVVQYFPGARYAVEVLRNAVRLLAPGGRIFIGDVRDLRHHRALRTAVELDALPAPEAPPTPRASAPPSSAASSRRRNSSSAPASSPHCGTPCPPSTPSTSV